MKKYLTPELDITCFDIEDIMTSTGSVNGSEIVDGTPGATKPNDIVIDTIG